MRDEIKAVIAGFMKQHGYPPTVREISREVNRRPSTVHGYLTAMIADGELETDGTTGASRAIRTPGLKWIDTREYAGTVRQLKRLQLHCQEMAAGDGCAADWKKDAAALERAVRALT